MHRLAIGSRLTICDIQFKVTRGDNIFVAGRVNIPKTHISTKLRPDPCNQLIGIERFCNIVVRANGQAENLSVSSLFADSELQECYCLRAFS